MAIAIGISNFVRDILPDVYVCVCVCMLCFSMYAFGINFAGVQFIRNGGRLDWECDNSYIYVNIDITNWGFMFILTESHKQWPFDRNKQTTRKKVKQK